MTAACLLLSATLARHLTLRELVDHHVDLGGAPGRANTGAKLLFEVFSQRYERGSILVTTNLAFDEWTEFFGSERPSGRRSGLAPPPFRTLQGDCEPQRLCRR